ncbi:hypothetical protein A0J61_10395 [Choanephora cucurbitarum]|uniref:Uncharacterized protein n=1 Tax=Choanephora cucurbitarum TaxID=101091 RepID=A0A1C7MYS7_9FUNG|nr:hypothetical protein A0J61_10395 [Choanephora cucurbitarum]
MDDRYHPAPMGAPPMHSHQLDPRLQYNPQPTMPAAMPTAPMASTLGPDNQRLEQAQKAQQILSMLAQQQQQPPTAPAMQATQPIPSLTSPFQPTNLQSPAAKQSPLPGSAPPTAPAASMHQPQQFISPVPPTNDQTSQVQQLLGLLSQAAQQQQQQQQQHQPQLQLPQQQPPQPQMTPQAQPAPQQASPSVIPQGVAPIPGMDAATALSQLAAMLQRQQQNQ